MTKKSKCQCERVSIEEMISDLRGGGWTSSHSGTIWTNLQGYIYRGPFKAWHVWAGVPMCEPD
jgi:hypothetical protein